MLVGYPLLVAKQHHKMSDAPAEEFLVEGKPVSVAMGIPSACG